MIVKKENAFVAIYDHTPYEGVQGSINGVKAIEWNKSLTLGGTFYSGLMAWMETTSGCLILKSTSVCGLGVLLEEVKHTIML